MVQKADLHDKLIWIIIWIVFTVWIVLTGHKDKVMEMKSYEVANHEHCKMLQKRSYRRKPICNPCNRGRTSNKYKTMPCRILGALFTDQPSPIFSSKRLKFFICYSRKAFHLDFIWREGNVFKIFSTRKEQSSSHLLVVIVQAVGILKTKFYRGSQPEKMLIFTFLGGGPGEKSVN